MVFYPAMKEKSKRGLVGKIDRALDVLSNARALKVEHSFPEGWKMPPSPQYEKRPRRRIGYDPDPMTSLERMGYS